MKNFRQKLPPLDPLIAFEAAARHLSFTQAAQELHLTQAAVSQQIRQLEDFLGVPLFLRAHRSVSLTQQGRDFQHTIAALLLELANATRELRVTDRDNPLTIATDQSIASLWLMPKLTEFRIQYPDIKLRLIASDDLENCINPDVDIAITFGDGQWKGYNSRQLFVEKVYPVCSPDYIQRFGEIKDAEDLVHHHLIELEDHNSSCMNWRRWLNAKNVDLPVERLDISLNSYPLVIDAAKNGQGIALAWQHLTTDELIQNQQLINPIGQSVESDLGYFVLWHNDQRLSEDGQAFLDWIQTKILPV
ncbi:MAG: LysR family transcriptional regulator [Oceanospirillum sp.]|nr:LysR family transcriptional regulator [Oceanospirillum sp.]